MAKKLIPLSAIDIILQADAATIREALESRLKIDELLVKREEAYKQIEEIELQVEALVGEDGAFIYPAPPLPVAGFSKLIPAARPAQPKPKPRPVEKAGEGAGEEAAEPGEETPEEDAGNQADAKEKQASGKK
jgi:hypothetical protein